MLNLLRALVGLVLLPACWAAVRCFVDAVRGAVGVEGTVSVEALSLLAGVAAFSVCWATISHPVRAYVLGHELTHALWGLLFGAVPSDVRVSERGGSVKLTKSNLLITLAPYFFPFYTFVVILAALVTYAFVRPLPWLPLWLFMIGFTWAFHILFTLETLTRRQPDVKLYGRLFSWSLIFLANLAIVLIWLAATTELTFDALCASFWNRLCGAYGGIWQAGVRVCEWTGLKTKGN